jgi:hypothetical protein
MERRLKELQESENEKKARSNKISESWAKALGGATSLKADELKVPHLLNLNEDPRLAETLVYPIDKAEVTCGRANKESPPVLEFNGMGICKNHCIFHYNAAKGTVILTPSPSARCLVNGVLVTEPTPLRHNNRVWLGNNYAFRFAFPGREEEGDKFTGEDRPDYIFAEAEIARKSSTDESGGALGHQLSDALKKVEQANIIATDLSRDAVFAPKIIKNRETGENIVVVHVTLPQGQLTWPWDKFNTRLVDMVKVWQEWQYAVANDKAFSLPDDNPFIDNGYQLVGAADVWLQSLANMIDLEAEPMVLSPIGVTEGKLQVSIVPLDKNGNEGPWDDDNEELDPFVESPDELKGKEIQFAVKINKMIFEVDLGKGGKPKYRDVFVSYRINDKFYEEPIIETPHDTAHQIEAKFNHMHKFKRLVDDEMYALLSKGKITFSVWGKLADLKMELGKTFNTVLPEGWKRVTAYQDPKGGLHLEPPK